MDISLTDIPLFQGVEEAELASMLQCLGVTERHYRKGETIFREGETTERIGVVLSGLALIGRSDMWGSHSVLGSAGPGAVFGEAYACIPGEPLLISVTAAEDTVVLFLNAGKVLTSCPRACTFHVRLVRNLLTVSAQKNVQLSRRIRHTGPKTIRGRLLSYFSECVLRSGKRSFQIPYNRQQLADYLGVDRSAMCHTLSCMQREGLIHYKGNRFQVSIESTELP